MQLINPPEWKRPKGYSNGVVARGSMVFVAGQIGWTGDEVFETDDFAGQACQAFANTLRVLQEAGAGPEHIVRMTWFITSKREYLGAAREVGQAFRDCFGKNFPAMAVMEVTALMEDRAKIEIETTAVIPD